jgi:molecular chaperone IbpA
MVKLKLAYFKETNMTLIHNNFLPIEEFLRALHLDNGKPTFPHHNIIKTETGFNIQMALAGYGEDNIDIETVENVLHVRGKIENKGDELQFVHHGIATRSFHRTIELNNVLKVVGASLQNGILSIDLDKIIPEELKPKKIPISVVGKKQLLTE